MAVVIQGKRRLVRVAIVMGVIVLTLVGCGAGLWAAWQRLFPDPTTLARRAYDRGDWRGAAQAARHALETHPDDPAALRLLARSTVQLGRAEAAVNLYKRRIDPKMLEADDYRLLGMAWKRLGQDESAASAWSKALQADAISPRTLEELTSLLLQDRRVEDSARAAARLSRQPGREATGHAILGFARFSMNDLAGAAAAFRTALARDPNAPEASGQPLFLRKLIARTFLSVASPAEARLQLEAILARGADPEASWLLSRVFLEQGQPADAQKALARAGSYRAANPLDNEPSFYVGEARCAQCHRSIFEQSLASRHTQSYYRGGQLEQLPRPDRPLPDPDNPKVTHALVEAGGNLWEETRAGDERLRALIEYAFGTSDRYLTAVSRDTQGRYYIERLTN